ncbi:Exosome complex exonuclease RRP4 [Giardia muris]|uniref:Exosome complex exonuclease RRP4 n=1 Tax=Giardia muris TaxID=5742 RepID=A0A4Z1T9I4_GIAMU|nr:Exosome complex exonuclease RRP4 [Giardia muris]|eukprot:TNJ29189.1 Exosome complex exonuclease RRP4 [Giardia muris]
MSIRPYLSPENLVGPGSHISAPADCVAGVGVIVTEAGMFSSLLGHVSRISKIVSVTPLTTIYFPQLADTVIGRVTQVLPNRWILDVGATVLATLQLDNINLPNLQRVKESADESNMRAWLDVGELVVCEMRENSTLLCRGGMFGKFSNGLLVEVPPIAIGKSSTAFQRLETIGVFMILGNNGRIWLAELPSTPLNTRNPIEDPLNPSPSPETLRKLCKLSSLILNQSRNGMKITGTSVEQAYLSETSMEAQTQ